MMRTTYRVMVPAILGCVLIITDLAVRAADEAKTKGRSTKQAFLA